MDRIWKPEKPKPAESQTENLWDIVSPELKKKQLRRHQANGVHFFVKYENRIRDFAEKSHASILTNHLFAFKDYFKERCFSLVSLHHVLRENRQNLRRFERVF